MSKQVIIFIAPPGAGKGTQADVICKQIGCSHVETSKILEERLAGQENSSDPEIKEAWVLFKNGGLMPPPLVARFFLEEVNKLHHEGKLLVFSGSPRTIYEAENEMPELEKLYGKENIKVFNITLGEEESIKRNSGRRICQASRHPIPRGDYDPKFKDITVCPWDGSPIITRALDKPEIIKERYRVYSAETKPVLDYLRDRGYKLIEINGEQPIEKVTEDILKHL